MPGTEPLIENQDPIEKEPSTEVNTEPTAIELNEEGIDSMTQAELQKYTATGEIPTRERDDKGRFIKGDTSIKTAATPAKEPVAAKPAQAPVQSVATAKTEPTATTTTQPVQQADGAWLEIEIDADNKLRFKNDGELKKSFVHAQKLIRSQKASLDKYNAERGQHGAVQRQLEESQAKITDLTARFTQLQANAAQITNGQQPTANPALAALQANGQATPEWIKNELTSLRNEIMAEREESAKIRGEFTETITGLRQKEAQAVIERNVQDLYREIKGLQSKHSEYATTEDFAKLDDIVSTYGEEAAQAMVSPSDYSQYQAVMGIVGLQKNNQDGKFDINRSNFTDLEEALLIHSHRNGTLGQAIVQAHKQGVAAFENVLNRNAQSAQTLPNNISGTNQTEIGDNEIDAILSMDVGVINANPELKQKFEAALKKLNVGQIPTQ